MTRQRHAQREDPRHRENSEWAHCFLYSKVNSRLCAPRRPGAVIPRAAETFALVGSDSVSANDSSNAVMASALGLKLRGRMADSHRMRFNWYILIVVVGALLAALVYWKSQSDLDAALHAYRSESSSEARAVVDGIEHTFGAVYEGLRTIARLPGVRRIDRYATNFGADAKQAVQEIYNNLALGVSMSEAYIVPADLDPERIDPVTGEPEAPIITFDELILGRTAEDSTAKDTTIEVEEIEIHEYRLMQRQLATLRDQFPLERSIEKLNYPAVTGPEVITCDNSHYSPNAPDDRHRSGLVYSVPFYGPDGNLRGEISGVILTPVLRDLVLIIDF